MILCDIEGTFLPGETVTTDAFRILKEDESSLLLETGDRLESEITEVETGEIIEIDTDRNLYKIKVATHRDNFQTVAHRSRLVGVTSGAVATIAQCDVAQIHPTVGTVSTSEGVLFGADGRISESSKKIQDSFYYQDFSYVVKVGNSINVWRDAVKRILHPVGLALFGEVSVATSVRARVYGGSEVRLNSTTPRFRQIQLLINKVLNLKPTARIQKLELEIFSELVYANLFPTRIMLEDGGRVLLEEDTDHYPELTGHPHYLRGESEVIGTGEGGVYPKLIYPSFPTPIANIDATMQMLKDVTLFLRDSAAAFDNSVNIPTSPNNTTADGNQHGKTLQGTDPTIILQTFEAYVNDLTMGHSTKRTIEIYKELSQVARSVQDVVTLFLPTITSADDLTAVATSKVHLIASLGLEDAMLHESFGSAKLGSTGYSIDRFKFLFPPYSAGTRSIDRGGRIYRDTYDSSVLTANYTGSNTSNDTYWDTYSNMTVANLNELTTIDDLINYPGRKTKFAFDSEIFMRDN